MPNLVPFPVFADAGAVVGLLVLIFTVVGWLVNLANSQNNPPAPPQNRPRPPRPKGDRVKNEIDIFLQEVKGQTIPQEDVVLEALPPGPDRARSRVAPPLPPEPQAAVRPRLGPASPHLESHVGEILASHHLASNVGEIQPPATHRPDPRTVGEMVALPTLGGQASKQSATPIVNLFRNRQSIQQAILVNEILSKPKAMRD